nr:MAG TPA: hypothetical protein [Caudoviricetes sp.]
MKISECTNFASLARKRIRLVALLIKNIKRTTPSSSL